MLNDATKKANVLRWHRQSWPHTFEAERRQVQHVCPDEVAGGQLRQLEVAEPAHTSMWIEHVEQQMAKKEQGATDK